MTDKLKREQKKRIDESHELLLAGDLEGARQQLEWAKAAEEIAAAQRKESKPWWAAFIAIICIVIAGLMMTFHVPKTTISADLIVNGAFIRFENDWSLTNAVVASELYIDNIHSLNTKQNPIAISKKLEEKAITEPLDIEIAAKRIVLYGLEIKKAALVETNALNGQLDLYIKGPPVKGNIRVDDGEVAIGGDLYSEDANIKQYAVYSFASYKTDYDAEPFHICARENVSWAFKNIRIDSLLFTRESPPGSGIWESTIISGEIKLHEVDAQFDLSEEDLLQLVVSDCERLDLQEKSGFMRVLYKGKVSTIKAGTSGFEKNYMPTILEFFNHNNRVVLFWGAIVFLWGLLWSWKNLLFR